LESTPKKYTLGTGHIKFFKNKLVYLKKRHKLIKSEMIKRGFVVNKSVSLKGFSKEYLLDWKPSDIDIKLIKRRIKEKIKMKPNFYRYYGQYKGGQFLLDLLA